MNNRRKIKETEARVRLKVLMSNKGHLQTYVLGLFFRVDCKKKAKCTMKKAYFDRYGGSHGSSMRYAVEKQNRPNA